MQLKKCFLLCLASVLLAGGLPCAAETNAAVGAKTSYDSYISGKTAADGYESAEIAVTGDSEFTVSDGDSVTLGIKVDISAYYSFRFA